MYVGAVYDYDTEQVLVWERDENGVRTCVPHPAEFYFYAKNENGSHTSVFGDAVEKHVFGSKQEMEGAIKSSPGPLFESDISPLFKTLMNRYFEANVPRVHAAFFDIEVDYDPKLGWSEASNPYAPINAITIYQQWLGEYVTLVVPPKGWKGKDTFEADLQRKYDEYGIKCRPNVLLCANETELLTAFLELIDDADIITGWNSEFFDLPYVVNRLLRHPTLKRFVNRLCFSGCKPPRAQMVKRFGNEEQVFRLWGRTHLDYLDLFKKFTFEGRTSYSLGNILAEEVDVDKITYDGSLAELYNNDFVLFVAYNIRDVEGLEKLDDKFKFIQLVNQMAHENTVLFENILGTVRYVETAIMNHCHHKFKRIGPDKHMDPHPKVEGAIVLDPQIGLHEWIGAVDIKSLYPNTIRSLNISPEKIVGQFSRGEDDWRAILINDSEDEHHAEIDGETITMTGSEWRDVLITRKWAVSGYGTIFDQGNGPGVVPDMLGYWYDERKRLQGEKKKWTKRLKELETAKADPTEIVHATKQVEHYDLLQLTKKIAMNSLYGALLNEAFTWGDQKLGASVTASGRQITTHMIETLGNLLSGETVRLVKSSSVEDGEASHRYAPTSSVIIYGDTDSCYFKTGGTSKPEAVELADAVADATNATFPGFMRDAFNCQPGFDGFIEAGRELVAERGLFQAKKKYVLKVVDLEGMAVDKLKSQGSELKKADTPKAVQVFLKQLMDKVLGGAPYSDLETYVNAGRQSLVLKNGNVLELGVAKQANNLDEWAAAWIRAGRPNGGKVSMADGIKAVPGHIRAGINYNELVQQHEVGAKLLKAGDKVIVLYLKANAAGIKSIAFPAEFTRLPAWFTENFSVDLKLTEEKLIDNKIGSIFSALGQPVPTPQRSLAKRAFSF